MQHNLRDPSRDRVHGRVYRITYEGRPLLEPVKIAGEPVETLLERLKEPEDRTRFRTRVELGARQTTDVIPAVDHWIAGLDKNDPSYEHLMLEGLWVYQSHNVVNADFLKRMLRSSDSRARAGAVRVLCYWRDRVPEALSLLKQLAADPYPRVRLEAVRAASFFPVAEAVEVPLISTEAASDKYLDYTRAETMRALEPYWKKAIAEGRPLALSSEAGARFFLGNLSTDELLKMKRSAAVYRELLSRKGVREEFRREAVSGLAKEERKPELRVLLDTIESLDEQKTPPDESVFFDLVRLLAARPATELAPVRSELEKLATAARLPVARQLGFVALVAADGGTEKAWSLGTKSIGTLCDFLDAIPLIGDPSLRASLFPKVEPLLHALSEGLGGSSNREGGPRGRYVRIELRGRRTLTLAEVEVTSDGRNVARAGKASQKNTANGGDAQHAIDGKTGGVYGDGGQTHTEERTQDPWWEVDLGSELPIDAITVFNRTEQNLGRRLEGFTLKVLDGRRNVVFEKERLPAPADKATYEVGGASGAGRVRRAAMLALPSMRGREAEAISALAGCVKSGVDLHSAIQALQRMPAAYWAPAEAKPLLQSILAYLRALPDQDRASPAARDALQLGDGLASLLPREEAKSIRKELGNLGVRVIRLGTVTDQMLFDKERLAARAGRLVEIVFENSDLMPHNFVVTQPGSLEEVGLLAESTATDQRALERHYVPTSSKILISSRLLQPRESQTLDFVAPQKPGVYPYVCTYPGHWRRMYGAFYIVEDLDEYLADPEAYLASHPLPVSDELLKFNRPRKEWKLDDLMPALAELEHGRSFKNGKQMFQVASCVACHRLNNEGTAIGPDLAQLDPKLTPAEILRDIVEPSSKINDKFQTNLFELSSGKTLTGVVLEETPDRIKVIENPLAQTPPVILNRGDILDRAKSPASIMPKGLLDKLTREEVLDLLAYVIARGDARNKAFQEGHAH
jgi:putative heme-binding domain-containing protein